MFTFYTILLAICAHLISIPFKKIQTKTDFLMWRKRVCCFENRLSAIKKKQTNKQTVRYVRKSTPKNQTELNAIEAIFTVVVVLFYAFFFNHTLFLNFISFYCFYPRLFQLRPWLKIISSLNSYGKFCSANNVFLSSQPFTIQNETNRISVLCLKGHTQTSPAIFCQSEDAAKTMGYFYDPDKFAY